jgi:hypothetical protein
MGCTMVRGAARTAERDEGGLNEPTFRGVFLTGLPRFLREGLLPFGAFYVGLELGGLATGILSAAAVSALIYVQERRAGRDGLLVRLSLAFVAVQSLVGLISHSATVYLAQPVLANAVWGAAFLVSVAVRRPPRRCVRVCLVSLPAPVAGDRCLQAGLRNRIARLGRLLPRPQRHPTGGAPARRARELLRYRRSHRARGDDPAGRLVGAVCHSPP